MTWGKQVVFLLLLCMSMARSKRCRGRANVGESCVARCDRRTGKWIEDSCFSHIVPGPQSVPGPSLSPLIRMGSFFCIEGEEVVDCSVEDTLDFKLECYNHVTHGHSTEAIYRVYGLRECTHHNCIGCDKVDPTNISLDDPWQEPCTEGYEDSECGKGKWAPTYCSSDDNPLCNVEGGVCWYYCQMPLADESRCLFEFRPHPPTFIDVYQDYELYGLSGLYGTKRQEEAAIYGNCSDPRGPCFAPGICGAVAKDQDDGLFILPTLESNMCKSLFYKRYESP